MTLPPRVDNVLRRILGTDARHVICLVNKHTKRGTCPFSLTRNQPCKHALALYAAHMDAAGSLPHPNPLRKDERARLVWLHVKHLMPSLPLWAGDPIAAGRHASTECLQPDFAPTLPPVPLATIGPLALSPFPPPQAAETGLRDRSKAVQYRKPGLAVQRDRGFAAAGLAYGGGGKRARGS
jgi:hypothetical protein